MARNLLSPLPTPRDSIAGRRSGCPLRSLPPVTVRAGIPLLIVIRRYSVTAPAFAITAGSEPQNPVVCQNRRRGSPGPSRSC